jgi:hypothetical protein
MCGGEGGECEYCEDGYFKVTECPTKYIGQELIQDIHLIGATDQHLPVAGGLLDQSAWWFELRNLLKLEEHRVESEKEKRYRP